MAATLMSQLETSVASVQREYAAQEQGAPLTDRNESLSDFCFLLERVLLAKSRKRDYWAFLLAALEKSPSAQPILRRIQTSPDNKTGLGKARSFIRACLQAKCLGSLLQEALQKRKITEQYYTSDSIFRSDTLSLRLFDAVYHLSDLECNLDPHLCLDDGWPTFQSKDFSAVPARRTRVDEELVSLGPPASESLPALSVARSVAESSDAGSSMPVDPGASVELDRLRTERALLVKERDDAMREKEESDAVWAATVSSLKDKAVGLQEKVVAAERQAATEKARADQLQALLAVDQQQLETAKARLIELEPKAAAAAAAAVPAPAIAPDRPATPPAPAVDPTVVVSNIQQQVQAEVENKYQQRLGEAVARAREAEERLRVVLEEHREAKESLQEQVVALEEQLAAERAAVAALEKQHASDEAALASAKEEHARAILELRQGHEQSLRAQDDRVEGLAHQLAAAAAERASLQAEIEALKTQLAAEGERLAVAEDRSQKLHAALEKTTQDKFRLYAKADELNDFAEQMVSAASCVWEDDKTVTHCRQCTKEFSLLRRKHHCRACGKVFCDTCSSFQVQLSSSPKPERACGSCSALLPRIRAKGDGKGEEAAEGGAGTG